MAEYHFSSAIDGDLDKAGNYTPNGIPGPSDSLLIDFDGANNPSTGTSNAGTVTNQAFIAGGTFNGSVLSNGGDINGGTFNGPAECTNSGYIWNGTYNGPVTVTQLGVIEGGTFSDLIIINGGFLSATPNVVIAATASLQVIGNGETLYGPEHASVAPPEAVLEGVSNLGTPGELVVGGGGGSAESDAGLSGGMGGSATTTAGLHGG